MGVKSTRRILSTDVRFATTTLQSAKALALPSPPIYTFIAFFVDWEKRRGIHKNNRLGTKTGKNKILRQK